MKQIFWAHHSGKILILLALSFLWGCAGGQGVAGEERVYKIIGPQIKGKGIITLEWSRERLERLGTEEIPSAYFDKALGYQGSRFRVISLSQLVRRMDPEGLSDAVLLNCFDDYQGIVSTADIRRYDIQLATRIEISPEYKRPDWLNPLLIVVPDKMEAPFQERYLTANIRELRFVKLEAYYAPLKKVAGLSTQEGFSAFKDNCLFCHSLMGTGGNKGVRLLERYDFSGSEDKRRFKRDFFGFHHKENPDKQNVEQFVSENQLQAIVEFLRRVQGPQSDALPVNGRYDWPQPHPKLRLTSPQARS